VLGDPRDVATQDWLEERLHEPFSYRLAQREEIVAYLSQQEEGLRAMDELAPAPRAARRATTRRTSRSNPSPPATARWCGW